MQEKGAAICSYEPVAWFYEGVAHVFSLGQVRAAKASQIQELRPGQRVLYVGVGSGEDALLAAQMGARVTCLDISQRMLDKTRRRLRAAGLDVELILCNVMDYRPAQRYDAVAANFFLNVFSEPVMLRILERLASLVKPGGKLLIADFAPPQGNVVARVCQRINWRIADVFFWTLRLMALHPIYDYSRYLPGLRMPLQSVLDFGIAGLPLYRSLVVLREKGTLSS